MTLLPSVSVPVPINDASTPGPTLGVPEVIRGGHFAMQAASQLLLSGSSLVKTYKVIPLSSTRNFPRVGSVATSMLTVLPVDTDWVMAGWATEGGLAGGALGAP